MFRIYSGDKLDGFEYQICHIQQSIQLDSIVDIAHYALCAKL